ncbi:MAG: DUF502 domain-containing protein [Burkholderiaceae bacterium]|nr:DUF502 domain-containing protein [Burkholderiaceae bacterium]
MQTLRSYFIAGLLIWAPLAITVWVLNLIIGTMDQSLSLLPDEWHPRALLGRQIPGLGVILTLLVILVTGVLARNFIGERLVRAWEGLLQRIPVVRSIYSSVKQVSDTLLTGSGQAFRKVLLVQYPRQGVWTIAFQTGTPADEVGERIMVDMVSVYVPTTPNPTSGFFLMMPRDQVIELSMGVDEALKYVVSMGVLAPPARDLAVGGPGVIGSAPQVEPGGN